MRGETQTSKQNNESVVPLPHTLQTPVRSYTYFKLLSLTSLLTFGWGFRTIYDFLII